jgi:hypothetical protein
MNSRVLLCLAALACALLAFAASASAKSVPAPVVKSISPMKLKVGEQLTVKGKGFIPGKRKTRVFFVRRGGGTAFARADKATKTKLVVTLPDQLDKVLDGKPARIQIRVLAKKFGKLSAARRSPVVSPAAGPGSILDPPPVDNTPTGPNGDCDKDGTLNSADTDDDNDLLPDTQETALGTDPCSADTDSDGVEDGYEYFSALDLNRTVLFGSRPPTPYPGKRPYPNPLFPDADTDFDGDGITLIQESTMWMKFGNHELPLNYSDGLQTTVVTPAPAGDLLQQLDTASSGSHYHDGFLDDGERDADGDGLSNFDETQGSMHQAWWTAAYEQEKAYPLTYGGTDFVDPDTDGDGIPDGADDEDHDGLSNAFEVVRPWNWALTYISVNGATPHDGTAGAPDYAPNPYARVNPFNPCKPVFSETCHRHPPFSYYADEDWQGLNPADAGAPDTTPGPIFP